MNGFILFTFNARPCVGNLHSVNDLFAYSLSPIHPPKGLWYLVPALSFYFLLFFERQERAKPNSKFMVMKFKNHNSRMIKNLSGGTFFTRIFSIHTFFPSFSFPARLQYRLVFVFNLSFFICSIVMQIRLIIRLESLISTLTYI